MTVASFRIPLVTSISEVGLSELFLCFSWYFPITFNGSCRAKPRLSLGRRVSTAYQICPLKLA